MPGHVNRGTFGHVTQVITKESERSRGIRGTVLWNKVDVIKPCDVFILNVITSSVLFRNLNGLGKRDHKAINIARQVGAQWR